MLLTPNVVVPGPHVLGFVRVVVTVIRPTGWWQRPGDQHLSGPSSDKADGPFCFFTAFAGGKVKL